MIQQNQEELESGADVRIDEREYLERVGDKEFGKPEKPGRKSVRQGQPDQEKGQDQGTHSMRMSVYARQTRAGVLMFRVRKPQQPNKDEAAERGTESKVPRVEQLDLDGNLILLPCEHFDLSRSDQVQRQDGQRRPNENRDLLGAQQGQTRRARAAASASKTHS